MTTLDASLTCYEDLTFKTTASCPLIAVPERNGTYSFDEANNQYSFKFSDEENPTLSTYDEAKNEYKISVVFSVGMPIPFELTYIPE